MTKMDILASLRNDLDTAIGYLLLFNKKKQTAKICFFLIKEANSQIAMSINAVI